MDTLNKVFDGDTLAIDTFTNKYMLVDHDNKRLESEPKDIWRRLARTISAQERNKEMWEAKFYDLLEGWKFVPGGRILFALGNIYHKASLKNCFVTQIDDDSLDAIYETARKIAKTQARGGGI